MNKFNHMFALAFTVENFSPDGEETTAAELRAAIASRLAMIDDDELIEACGMPLDTYEVDMHADHHHNEFARAERMRDEMAGDVYRDMAADSSNEDL